MLTYFNLEVKLMFSNLNFVSELMQKNFNNYTMIDHSLLLKQQFFGLNIY